MRRNFKKLRGIMRLFNGDNKKFNLRRNTHVSRLNTGNGFDYSKFNPDTPFVADFCSVRISDDDPRHILELPISDETAKNLRIDWGDGTIDNKTTHIYEIEEDKDGFYDWDGYYYYSDRVRTIKIEGAFSFDKVYGDKNDLEIIFLEEMLGDFSRVLLNLSITKPIYSKYGYIILPGLEYNEEYDYYSEVDSPYYKLRINEILNDELDDSFFDELYSILDEFYGIEYNLVDYITFEDGYYDEEDNYVSSTTKFTELGLLKLEEAGLLDATLIDQYMFFYEINARVSYKKMKPMLKKIVDNIYSEYSIYKDTDFPIEIRSWGGFVINRPGLFNIPDLNLENVSGVPYIATDDFSSMFYNYYYRSINGIDRWDFSGVKNMSYMFYGANILGTMKLNTPNVTNMTEMFGGYYGDYGYQHELIVYLDNDSKPLIRNITEKTGGDIKVSIIWSKPDMDRYTIPADYEIDFSEINGVIEGAKVDDKNSFICYWNSTYKYTEVERYVPVYQPGEWIYIGSEPRWNEGEEFNPYPSYYEDIYMETPGIYIKEKRFADYEAGYIELPITPETAANLLIDWGDGTVSNKNYHYYLTPGKYILKIDGEFAFDTDFTDVDNLSEIIRRVVYGSYWYDMYKGYYFSQFDPTDRELNDSAIITSKYLENVLNDVDIYSMSDEEYSELINELSLRPHLFILSSNGLYEIHNWGRLNDKGDDFFRRFPCVNLFDVIGTPNIKIEIEDIQNLQYLTGIKGLELWDFTNVENMEDMFYGKSFYRSIKLTAPNVLVTAGMFSEFKGYGDIEILGTSKLEDAEYMFCYSSLRMDNIILDTSNVTNMSNMFIGTSYSGKPINLSNAASPTTDAMLEDSNVVINWVNSNE